MNHSAQRTVCRRGRCARHALGVLLTALTAAAAAQPPERPADGSWPRPVAQFIQRSENCQHFAGEFGGDGSPRDAEVNRQLDALRCNSLPADLRTLRQRYRADAQVTARLAAFDDDGMPIDTGSDD